MGTRVRILALAVLAAVGACSSSRKLEAPLPARDPARLSHEQHAQVGCIECHPTSASAEGTQARPGSDDHAPCDRRKCHEDAFLGKPSKLCEVCHTEAKAGVLGAPLKPYPVEDAWQVLPSRFSHRIHLDAQRMELRVGFHVACTDCHVRDDKLVRPNHATCARCHATEVGLPRVQMPQCDRCHEQGMRERDHKRLIHDDLKFTHDQHREDRRGTQIKCDQCHSKSTTSATRADHAPPRIEVCVACHDDSDRTPSTMRMRICEACHREREQSLTAIAPRNHLPATEKPIDHTLAFRRDHSEVAERDATRCAACHTQMSGNPRDACDECHQTMLPSDHRLTFRELDHGAEAAADRSRCAQCHVIEFCTACHSIRPRSHGFPGRFQFAEHANLARVNVRSCMTCHEERFCLDCHSQGVR